MLEAALHGAQVAPHCLLINTSSASKKIQKKFQKKKFSKNQNQIVLGRLGRLGSTI
jgi:hypothetical protein